MIGIVWYYAICLSRLSVITKIKFIVDYGHSKIKEISFAIYLCFECELNMFVNVVYTVDYIFSLSTRNFK